MAGSAPIEEKPKLGRGATIAGLVFALLVLTGFSAGTAVSYRDTVEENYSHHDEDHGDDHADDHGDEEHGEDDHAEDDHGE